jgi:hypothetical protein
LKNLSGEKFIAKSKMRTLELVFENDSICRLTNTFDCKDLDPEVKEITIISKYERKGDLVFIRNVNCKKNDCHYSLTKELPFQKSSKCKFLNEGSRGPRANYIGPRYMTDYEKFGLVLNVDIDTLHIVKRKIFFVKSENGITIGWEFKKR